MGMQKKCIPFPNNHLQTNNTFYNDGSIKTVEVLCEDYSQYIKYYKKNSRNISSVKYMYTFKNGKLHNTNDNPAILKQSSDGYITKMWYTNGELNRKGNKPAVIIESKDGTIEKYYTNGIETD